MTDDDYRDRAGELYVPDSTATWREWTGPVTFPVSGDDRWLMESRDWAREAA